MKTAWLISYFAVILVTTIFVLIKYKKEDSLGKALLVTACNIFAILIWLGVFCAFHIMRR
jgi:hypothetical protein